MATTFSRLVIDGASATKSSTQDSEGKMTISLTQPAIGSTGWGDDVNTNFDTIETAINTGGAGGPPTPTTWGANTETLAADKTLVDGDDTIQYLNPGSTDRTVYLPTPGASNRLFLIYNTATADADLLVRRGLGTLATLSPRQGAWCASDGALWAVFSLGRAGDVVNEGVQVYSWVGDISTTTRRLAINQLTSATPFLTTDTPAAAYEIPSAGTVDKVVQVVQTDGNQTYALYKNGASSESLTASGFTATAGYYSKIHDTNTSVSASDYLSVVLTATPALVGDQRVFAFLRASAAGLELRWGGYPSSVSRVMLPTVAPESFSNEVSANTVTEHLIGIACSDVSLALATALGDGTTVCKIWKNGAVVDTLYPATAFWALATVGTSYAPGDGVTIESHDAGTSPGTAVNAVLALSTGGVLATTFAGDSGGTNTFLGIDQNYANPNTATTATQEHGFVMPYAGVSLVDALQTVGLSSETWALRKNGATDQTIDPSADEEVVTLSGTPYYPGDYVEMTCSVSGGEDSRHRIHFSVFGGQ